MKTHEYTDNSNYIGKILFYLLWPLIWLYAPLTRRVRAIIIQDNAILVVKNFLGPQKWQLPGGGIKFSETPRIAITRELKEELNVDAYSIHKIHDEIIIVRQYGLLMRYHFVRVELTKNYEIQPSKEIVSATWLPITKLQNTLKEVQKGLTLI